MNFPRYFIIIFLFPVFLLASQFAQFGDLVSATIDSSATYSTTSNVYKTPTKTADNYFIWSPGLKFDLGYGDSNFDLSLKLAYDMYRYQELSNLDSDLLTAMLYGSYRGAVTQVLFHYGINEGQSAQADLTGQSSSNFQDLIQTKNEFYSIKADYRYSPKISFSGGINASDFTYTTYTDQYASKKSFTVPLEVFYHYSTKLSGFYGLEFRHREIGQAFNGDGNYEADSIYYKLGLRGELKPKIDGNVSVGIRNIEYSNEDTENYDRKYKETFGIRTDLKWRVSPKFISLLNTTRDYDTAGSGNSYHQTRVRLLNRYLINSEFSLSADAIVTSKKFVSGSRRTDEMNRYTLNLDYFPDEYSNFTVGYGFVDSRAISKYNESGFNFKISVLY